MSTSSTQRQTQAQAAFITCPADRRALQALADEIEAQLVAQGIPAPIMMYGVGTKRREGFIALESATGMPPAFVRWLSEHEDILECVVYDVPRDERERGAMNEQREALGPPCVPEGYTIIGEPVPLLTTWDSRWIARARGSKEDEGEGFLIYEDARTIAFLTTKEALATLAYLVQESRCLLAAHATDPTLSDVQAQAVEHLRALWWLEETRKARAILKEGQR